MFLTPLYIPDFKVDPKSFNYVVGSKITLTCAAPGHIDATLTPSWNHNNLTFTDATSSISSMVFDGDATTYKKFELVWTADSLSYTGTYQCNITYAATNLGSYAFSGGVLTGPRINIIMVGVTDLSDETFVRKGQEAKLSCSIQGDGQATWIRWYHANNNSQVGPSLQL